jgi:hypothetical protein
MSPFSMRGMVAKWQRQMRAARQQRNIFAAAPRRWRCGGRARRRVRAQQPQIRAEEDSASRLFAFLRLIFRLPDY